MSPLRPWLCPISGSGLRLFPSLQAGQHFETHHTADKHLVLPCCTCSPFDNVALQPLSSLTPSVKPSACTTAALSVPIGQLPCRRICLTHRSLRLQPLIAWLVRVGTRKRSTCLFANTHVLHRPRYLGRQDHFLTTAQTNPAWLVCASMHQAEHPLTLFAYHPHSPYISLDGHSIPHTVYSTTALL